MSTKKSNIDVTLIEIHNDNSVNRLKQYKCLGLKIAFYRKLRNLTQLDLAEKVGLSRTYISNIEAPKTMVNPTMDVIFDIAHVLDVPVSKLFDPTVI